MGPEQKKLMDRLFNDPTRKLVNFNLTRGDGPATSEQICAEVNNAMDRVEVRQASGDMGDGPARSGKPPVDMRRIFANGEMTEIRSDRQVQKSILSTTSAQGVVTGPINEIDMSATYTFESDIDGQAYRWVGQKPEPWGGDRFIFRLKNGTPIASTNPAQTANRPV